MTDKSKHDIHDPKKKTRSTRDEEITRQLDGLTTDQKLEIVEAFLPQLTIYLRDKPVLAPPHPPAPVEAEQLPADRPDRPKHEGPEPKKHTF